MKGQSLLSSEIIENHHIILNWYSDLDLTGIFTFCHLLFIAKVPRFALIEKLRKRKKMKKLNSRNIKTIIEDSSIIRSLSKSKLLPNSDYEKGNYTGNASYKPGDVRARSPRRQRFGQRGGWNIFCLLIYSLTCIVLGYMINSIWIIKYFTKWKISFND